MGGKSTKPKEKIDSPVSVESGLVTVGYVSFPSSSQNEYQTRPVTTSKPFDPFNPVERRQTEEAIRAAASVRSSGYDSRESFQPTSTVRKPIVTTPTSPVTPLPALSRPPPDIQPATKRRPQASNSIPASSKAVDGITASLLSLTVTNQRNVPGTEAVIVGRLRDGSRLVQTLPQAGASEWLILDVNSKNTITNISHQILPELQAFIKVTKMGMNQADEKLVKYHVDEYFVHEIYNEPIGVQMVAAVDTAPGVVTVVGRSFVEPTIVPWEHPTKAVKGGDFLIGNAHRLKPFFSSTLLHGVVCYVKNLEEERKYLEAVEKHKKHMQMLRPPREPENVYYMTGVRTLFDHEYKKIATNCRAMNVVPLQDANLYIRDVYIAIARLEKVTRLKSIEEHTLQVNGETTVDRSGAHARLILTVRLTSDDVQRVITGKSQDTWRIGTDLSIRHPELERHMLVHNEYSGQKTYEGGMTIEKIDHNKTTNKATVRFRPHPRSYDLFDVILQSKTYLKGIFTIGPSDDYIETIVETLQSQAFAEFVQRGEIFDSWRGVKKNKKIVIPNLALPFDVNGDQLDDSQQVALRTAMGNPGFTCVEAPPGSGKTFLIAAMIAAKYQQNTPGVICISATTNNAISNAIDKTHECYEFIKKTREYSRKMEEEINDKSKKISLRQMALNAGNHIDLEKHKNLSTTLEGYKSCKKALQTVHNKEEGLALLDELQSADYQLRQSFLEAYQPDVIGSTCELVARRGDHVWKKINKVENEEEKKRLKKCAITHLILDEASQLPPHLALAVYIMLPGLQKITLIGDSEQLGPYTPLDEKTFVFRMIGAGELSRVGGHDGIQRVHLRSVYRSHPKIVNLLLSPIYGPELKSGLGEHDRDLASEKNLPVAKDNSPVLFVNIENAKNDIRGVNMKELRVVLDFIQVLKQKGVTGTDVAVVCNHHAQRQAIMDALKGKGDIGVLNTSVAVHTVDSFQGKEAKVVLVLTTKVSTSSCLSQTRMTLQFVANPNRGCVAVSRGQHAVYLFGDWLNLAKTKFWAKFVEGIVKSEAMVNDQWEPASVENYIKLKTAALMAPQPLKNSNFGGRGTHKPSIYHNRGRGGHHVGEHKKKEKNENVPPKHSPRQQNGNHRGHQLKRVRRRGRGNHSGGAAATPSQPVAFT